jgi:membrane-associated protease RseP (regulator of RpoE activity)
MRLTVLRAGKKQDLALRLVPAPEIPARNATLIKGNSPLQGATVVNVSPAVKEEFSINGVDSGIAIGEVEPGSSAEQVGFRKGDVILAINGQRIEDMSAIDKATRTRIYLWRVTFNRGGQTFTTAFGG